MTKQEIRNWFKSGNMSQGEAIRLLTFHHNMSYMDALRYLGVMW